jgi:hypothetical protein
MAFDVAVKAISSNDVQGGDLVIFTPPMGSGNYQRLDVTDYLPEPPDDAALSGMYYDRFDNKGYY